MKTTTAMMMMSVDDWQREYQRKRSAKYISNTAFSLRKFILDIFYQVKVVKASEAIRSRRHVQTQGCVIHSITMAPSPKIQCVTSQQVKNLSKKD